MLKAFLGRLFGGAAESASVEADAVEYEGFCIRPAPFISRGQYQTCGIIEKEISGELKQHRFVRAESHSSREEAVEFSLFKARQLIDDRGDRLFD